MRPLMIEVINPAYDRSKSGGHLFHPRDFILTPAVRHGGTVPLIDTISDDSIRNLIIIHNALTAPERKRKKALNAPAKARV